MGKNVCAEKNHEQGLMGACENLCVCNVCVHACVISIVQTLLSSRV